VTPWTPRLSVSAGLLLLSLAGSSAAQSSSSRRGSIVIVTGEQPTMPIPTMMEGAAGTQGNLELADQLFCRLAGLGPTLLTAGDRGFVPLLARSWTRRDSVTLAFDLDPRARWQDGVPVTARDVVFTFERARNPSIAPRLVALLRRITSVTAEGERRVVFRFSEPYAEQLYDATFHAAPLPAHLLDTIPPEGLARSSFVTHPVGSGPYRLVRTVAGQFVELAANQDFFLGRPKIGRVIIRVASDPDARINLLLSGQADAIDNVIPPLDNLHRIKRDTSLRLIPVPSPSVGFLLFNQRDPADPAAPHPVLSDLRVRRAITLGLDRHLLVHAVFGSYAEVPYGPVSSILWIRNGAPKARRQDVEEARQLLAAAGWRDSDSDGILEFPLWIERRTGGKFDIDFAGTIQDPSPSGLTQAWSCTGGTNVAKYCNPRVDSLLDVAIRGQPKENPGQPWFAALRQIEDDAPATFLYAPFYVYAVKRHYRNVSIMPASSWLLLREWSDSR
jgi:ABC-type transport system substrate-binding protein